MNHIAQIEIGITTAPRREPLLAECCRSLTQAGAGAITVFAEPGTDLSALDPTTRIIQRSKRLGAWHNWRTMCRELLDRQPAAQIILTVQDDTIFSRDALKMLLDAWPNQKNVGFVSLYTASHYQRKWCVERAGKTLAIRADSQAAAAVARRHPGTRVVLRDYPHGIYKVGTRSLWGACALAFPRDVLKKVIDHRIANQWCGARSKTRTRKRESWEIANVDTAIGQILNALRLDMLFVNPSLAQHAAEHSTLGHGGLGGRRQSWRVAADLLTVAPGAIAGTARATLPHGSCGEP